MLDHFSFKESFKGLAFDSEQDAFIMKGTEKLPNLYADTKLFKEDTLAVSSLHTLFFEQHGNPNGQPVLIVHGGPGGPASNFLCQLFDPSFYHIILLHQRGAGKSIPYGEIREDTTRLRIDDIETLRKHLKIEKWALFGVSWGGLLSLAYAEMHPNRCQALILGATLGSSDHGMQLLNKNREVFPDEWNTLVDEIPEIERENLVAAFYHRIVAQTDPEQKLKYSKILTRFIMKVSCASLLPEQLEAILENMKNEDCINITTHYLHYAMHQFFLDFEEIKKNIKIISHLPVCLLHGMADKNCLSSYSTDLHKVFGNNSTLVLIEKGEHNPGDLNSIQTFLLAIEGLKKFYLKSESEFQLEEGNTYLPLKAAQETKLKDVVQQDISDPKAEEKVKKALSM